MKHFLTALAIGGMLAIVPACSDSGGNGDAGGNGDTDAGSAHTQGDDDGQTHDGHDHAEGDHDPADDDDQADDDGGQTNATSISGSDQPERVSMAAIGTAMIGDTRVKCAQRGGGVQAGKEATLFVKVAYEDYGSTIVRAWLGTEDRSAWDVGTGEYVRARNGWDVTVTAPDPLSDDMKWWIEIEKPDGTKGTGSIHYQ